MPNLSSNTSWIEILRDIQTAGSIADDIVSGVKSSSQIHASHEWLNGENPMRLRRVWFNVKLESECLSAFMNDRSGYRGHYFDDPDDGTEFNQNLIQRIKPILRSHYNACDFASNDSCDAFNSNELELSFSDSKLWLTNEFQSEGRPSCLEWGLDRWPQNACKYGAMLVARKGFSEEEATAHYTTCIAGKPDCKQIKRIGPFKLGKDGWLSVTCAFVRDGKLHTDVCKKDRAIQIHCFGAS